MKLTEILDKFEIPYKTKGHHHCRPGWIQMDCPYCGKNSHKWHLGYSIEGRFCSCWRCGWHPIIDVISELADIPFSQAKSLLGTLTKDIIQKAEKPKGKLIIPKGVEDIQSAHKRYLKNRGFDYQKIKLQWEIKGIGIASRLSWRIFIPIHYKGNIVSWTTRSITNNGARYISAAATEEKIPHKSLLYGEDYATHSIIITEGPFDVWKIGPGAVATLGVGYSNAQIEKIIKYPRRAVCFDSDKEAQKRAKKLCDVLSLYKGETFNILLDEKDAGEADESTIKKLRKFLE